MRHSRKEKRQIKADTDQMPLSAAATPLESVGKCQVNERNQDIDKPLASYLHRGFKNSLPSGHQNFCELPQHCAIQGRH